MNILFRDKHGNERPASMREVMMATGLDQTMIEIILDGKSLSGRSIETPTGAYWKQEEAA